MIRSRGGGEESESPSGKETTSSSRLLRLITILIVFAAGTVIGLASSSHTSQYFIQRLDPYNYVNIARANKKTMDKNYCTMVPPCEEDCLSMGNFLHPKNVIHNLTDEELFWRASLVTTGKKYPYDRIPKVAFMFLTRGPLPMIPLWEKFFHGHEKLFSIYVHALPGYVLNVSTSSAFHGRQIPSKDVKWGSATITDGEKRLMGNALLDFSNERFILLSESCIPVYDFKTVYRYLMRSMHSFVDSYDDPSRYGRGRYSRRMSPDIKLSQWRKGSQWFELSRSLATQIVSETKYYSMFRKHCRPSCYPDEHYLPTYLNMFHSSESANRSVTWVDWSLGGPHPAAYGRSNVTASFLSSIRTNNDVCSYNYRTTFICYLFARKFEPGALEPLLNLSSTVMGF